MAESAVDARPDMEVDEATLASGGGRPRRWSGTDRRIPGGPGGELARASGDEDGSSVDPRRPAVGTANLARTTDDLRRQARDNRMTASAQPRPLGSVPIEPCRTIWRIRRGQRPVTFRKKDETIGGAPSSRESAGDGHQRTRFGAVSDSGSQFGSGDRPPAAVRCGQALRSWLFRVLLTCWNIIKQRLWWSACSVRDEEAAGSNPATPTRKLQVAALFRG